MYEQFRNHFDLFENKEEASHDITLFKQLPPQLFQLLSELGGKSFDKGLYRIHDISSSIQWSIKIQHYYTTNEKKVYPFGYDWLGRQFCVSAESNDELLMFDAATGDYFKFKQDLITFHNEELVHDKDGILSSNFFKETLKSLKLPFLPLNDCVGHITPLFLGGHDEISNLKKQNMEVYWDIHFQILFQVKNLPPGTPIKSIRFER